MRICGVWSWFPLTDYSPPKLSATRSFIMSQCIPSHPHDDQTSELNHVKRLLCLHWRWILSSHDIFWCGVCSGRISFLHEWIPLKHSLFRVNSCQFQLLCWTQWKWWEKRRKSVSDQQQEWFNWLQPSGSVAGLHPKIFLLPQDSFGFCSCSPFFSFCWASLIWLEMIKKIHPPVDFYRGNEK